MPTLSYRCLNGPYHGVTGLGLCHRSKTEWFIFVNV